MELNVLLDQAMVSFTNTHTYHIAPKFETKNHFHNFCSKHALVKILPLKI